MTKGSQQEKYMKTKIYQEDNSGLQLCLQAGARTCWVDFLPLIPTILGLSLGLCVSSTEMSILCHPTSPHVLSMSLSPFDSYSFTDSLIFSPSVSLFPMPHFQERIFPFKTDSERVRHVIYIVAQGTEMCLDLCLYKNIFTIETNASRIKIYPYYKWHTLAFCILFNDFSPFLFFFTFNASCNLLNWFLNPEFEKHWLRMLTLASKRPTFKLRLLMLVVR